MSNSVEGIPNFKPYLGNKNLKRSGVEVEWNEERIEEYIKCQNDPIYFNENYVKIVHVDRGLVNFKLYDYQKKMMTSMKDNRYTIITTARQAGKCVNINTPIDIRINGGPKQTITIGELYEIGKNMSSVQNAVFSNEEDICLLYPKVQSNIQGNSEKQKAIRELERKYRLRYMRDMWFSCSSIIGTLVESPDFNRRISNQIQQTNCSSEIFRENKREYIGGKESLVQSSGYIIPIFEEVSVPKSTLYRGDVTKSKTVNNSRKNINENRVLLSPGSFRGSGQAETQREANNIFFEEMSGEIWSGGRSESLGTSSKEMAEYFDIKTNRRDSTNQQEETNSNWKNIKGRTRHSISIKKRWNRSESPIHNNETGQKNICLRHSISKQNNRVQWRLLALQSRNLSKRLCNFKFSKDCSRYLGQGSSEKDFSRRQWISSYDNLGKGLQVQSQSDNRKSNKLSDNIERKFIDIINLNGVEVWSDSGWEKVTSVNKTIPYKRWVVKTISGLELLCADTHILFDENLNEVFAKDLIPGISKVSTENGSELISKVIETDITENMFDLSVDSDNHRFYSGGFLSHNSTTTIGFILWYILFNENKTVALLANKGETAREILGKVHLAYEHLPKWMQQGIKEWNKGTLELENSSRVIASATSGNNIRGFAINLLFIDEAAFIENWDEFFTSVYPTISSGETTKVILVSTPNGLNHFYRLWEDAVAHKNSYNAIRVTWQDVPGRNEAWQKDVLSNMGYDYQKFAQEHEADFQGSSGTLIAGKALKALVTRNPVVQIDGVYQYALPEKEKRYCIVADVSRGKGLDYSAFQVIDTTQMPYQQACVYRNNNVTPLDYADVIHRCAKAYNNALVLIEINDIGAQVADSLAFDFEYDNILYTENAGAAGKRITGGGGSKNTDRGVRTTTTLKSVGCSMLKLLVEQQQLILIDHNTIEELSRFSRKGKTYEAEPGYHDDLVMCLVLFAWLADQQYFRDVHDISTLQKLRDKTEDDFDTELSVLGFWTAGLEEAENKITDPSDEFFGGTMEDVDFWRV